MVTSNAVRILVIEDEPKIAGWLVQLLEQANFSVVAALNGETGLRLAETERPDVVLLDLMLPDMDGLDVCRMLRRRSDVLILMLTARIDETDRLIGLEMGADDYITKPFSPREVIARIRAFLRRANGSLSPEPKALSFGPLTLTSAARTCILNDKPILLTPTEFAILETLMQHPGIVYTRETLMTDALGYDYAAYERTIDAHIRNLRRKIEADMHDPQFIQTVFGVGYRFAERQEIGS